MLSQLYLYMYLLHIMTCIYVVLYNKSHDLRNYRIKSLELADLVGFNVPRYLLKILKYIVSKTLLADALRWL